MATEKLFSEQLRQAIEQAPISRYELAKRSGVSQAALSLFVNEKAGLSTATIDLLAPVLGLKLTLAKSPKKGSK